MFHTIIVFMQVHYAFLLIPFPSLYSEKSGVKLTGAVEIIIPYKTVIAPQTNTDS